MMTGINKIKTAVTDFVAAVFLCGKELDNFIYFWKEYLHILKKRGIFYV